MKIKPFTRIIEFDVKLFNPNLPEDDLPELPRYPWKLHEDHETRYNVQGEPVTRQADIYDIWWNIPEQYYYACRCLTSHPTDLSGKIGRDTANIFLGQLQMARNQDEAFLIYRYMKRFDFQDDLIN